MNRSKYQVFPPLPPARQAALKASITNHGVESATTYDADGNLLDGWERETICHELGVACRREVQHFDTEAQKFQFVLNVNAHRRPSLSQREKQGVIEAYLRGDPGVADNTLGEILGVSKNTVLRVRQRLEANRQIRKVTTTRGKDGKNRPVKYAKRILANTQHEFKKALEFIHDLPANLAGKTIDVATAKRRISRARSRQVRAAKAAKSYPLPDSIKLHHCSFQRLEEVAGLKPASVNHIIVDIPYAKAWLAQVADLGSFAARVLVPGGLLIVMTGIQYIDDILCKLKKRKELKHQMKLETVWETNTGSPCYLDNASVVISSSKPIWVYSKGPFLRKGRFITPVGPFSREKDWHPHQQPLELFRHLVREYTDPGDMVIDTCGGGFTTALSCYLEGRYCISCDIDEEAVKRGTERLNKAMRGEPDKP